MKYIFFALFVISCTKEYHEQPSCRRVYMFSDKYGVNGMHTDTLWPWGKYNNVVCNQDTLAFYNSKADTCVTLCSGERECIRYIIK